MESKNIFKVFLGIFTVASSIFTILEYYKPGIIFVPPPIVEKPEPEDKSSPKPIPSAPVKESEIINYPASNPSTSVDYSQYLNISAASITSKYDIAVCFLNEQNKFESSLTQSVSQLYKTKGYSAISNLFSNNFLKSNYFEEVFSGNNNTITKMKLSAYTQKLAIGKISMQFQKGDLVEGTIICQLNLKVNIVSTQQGSLTDSFTISNVSGNGTTESAAKSQALQKALSLYLQNHLNL